MRWRFGPPTNTASGSCPSGAGSGVRAGIARQRLCSSATSGAISMPLHSGGRDAPGSCCFRPCPSWCVCLPSPSLPMPLVQDEADSSSACWIAPGDMWAARCRCPQGPIGAFCLRTRPSCSPPKGCGRRPMRPYRHVHDLYDLQTVRAQGCQQLHARPEAIEASTNFHRWPQST
jgi:hypothetical protein